MKKLLVIPLILILFFVSFHESGPTVVRKKLPVTNLAASETPAAMIEKVEAFREKVLPYREWIILGLASFFLIIASCAYVWESDWAKLFVILSAFTLFFGTVAIFSYWSDIFRIACPLLLSASGVIAYQVWYDSKPRWAVLRGR